MRSRLSFPTAAGASYPNNGPESLWATSRRASLEPEMSKRGSLRASDADREQIAERLRQAAAEGRLLTEELEHRLGVAFSARTYDQLDPLVSDLPREVTTRSRRSPALPTPAVAIAVLLLMPVVVAVVVAAVVLVASMFAVWAVVAVVLMWMFGHRRPMHPGQYYGRARQAYGHRWR
jgi:Flp pilus assembly protein TadB